MNHRVLLVDISVVPIALPERSQEVVRRRLLLQAALRRSILPRVVCPPIPYSRGLLTLGTSLRNAGIDVDYVVWPDPRDRSLLPVLARSADVVGITCMTSGHGAAANAAAVCRHANPSCCIVLGGPHATGVGSQLLDEIPGIDGVVLGAGHPTLVHIVDSAPAIHGVPGVSTRQCPDAVPQPEAYAEAVVPDYRLLSRPVGDYQHSFRTYHGCPNGCAFCAEARTFGAGSLRPLELVFEELGSVLPCLPSGTLIHFSDPVFNLVPERTLRLCAWLEEQAQHLYLSLDMCVDRLSQDWVAALRAAGFRYFRVGVESLTQRVLDTVSKRVTVGQVYDVLEDVRANGADSVIHAYWITGLPGSTPSTLERGVAHAAQLVQRGLADIFSNKVFVPYPGTACFRHPETFGLTLLHQPWEAHDRLSPPVYHLENLGSGEIYESFLRTERAVADALEQRVRCSSSDLGAGMSEEYKSIAYLGHLRADSSPRAPRPGDGSGQT